MVDDSVRFELLSNVNPSNGWTLEAAVDKQPRDLRGPAYRYGLLFDAPMTDTFPNGAAISSASPERAGTTGSPGSVLI